MNRDTMTWTLLALAGLGVVAISSAEAPLEFVIRTFGTEVSPDAVRLPNDPGTPVRGSETMTRWGKTGSDVEVPLGPPTARRQDILFDGTLPEAPSRLRLHSRNPKPPTVGRLVVETASATRAGQCATALHVVQEGMHEVSPDYAGLVVPAWQCFDDVHVRELAAVEVRTPDRLDVVFENLGSPVWTVLDAHPFWYRPASRGLEFRLERLTADPMLAEALDRGMGEEILADSVASDVHLEILAAEALSRLPPSQRTARLEDEWARRVFYAEWALDQAPGELIEQHRNELYHQLRVLLDEVLTDREVDGQLWPVPPVVRRAASVGRGDVPPPS